MDRKTFFLILSLLVATFTMTFVIRFAQPESSAWVSLDDFPMEKENWQGVREVIPQYVTDLLRPLEIISATFVNRRGTRVHLLFDFFTTGGGPHSPRNCLPGSGWEIAETGQQLIRVNGREIMAGRFKLKLEQSRKVMDFWYITNYGETANDYLFKLYSMIGSLRMEPRDVAFVRLVADDTPEGRAALEEFESLFIPEIYARLPFE